MASFRLLTRRPLRLVTHDETWAQSLRSEGYDIVATPPALTMKLILSLASGILRRRSWHWVIDAPLTEREEAQIAWIARWLPMSIASWTRHEPGRERETLRRLEQIAEDRDWSTRKEPRERIQTQPGSPARALSEFDHFLKAPPP